MASFKQAEAFVAPIAFEVSEADSDMEVEEALVSKRHHHGATFNFL